MNALDPATLAGSLHDTRAFIHRYMRLTSDEATLVSVWAALTHAVDAVDYCPYLHVTSPLPECGKSRLLEILQTLVAKPWMTGRVTAAVLMRKIDKEHPTLLLDESDAAFNGADEQYSEALRGMLNLGFHRRGKASVCVGQSKNIGYQDFSVFGPKCIAGIGRLPSTVESRSIPIALKRRMKNGLLKKWRDRWLGRGAAIRERIAAAMANKLDVSDRPDRKCRTAYPTGRKMSGTLVRHRRFSRRRMATPVRDAALALMGRAVRQAREAELDLPLELLTDIQQIFLDLHKPEVLPTKTLIEQLVALDDRPWAVFGRSEKPITGHRISRLLKAFGVVPAGKLRLKNETVRGYRSEVFTDAFARYVDLKAEQRNKPNESGPETPKTKAEQAVECSTLKTAVDPDKHWVCSTVPLSNPEHEGANGHELSLTDQIWQRSDDLFKKGWH